MKKIEGLYKKDVTIRMDVKLWGRLFMEAHDASKDEVAIVSVPEIIRRILYKHYKKRGEK